MSILSTLVALIDRADEFPDAECGWMTADERAQLEEDA